MLMITHDVDLIARYAHRLIVLHQGHILLDGPTPEVFSQVEEQKSFVVPPVAARLAWELASVGVPPHVMTLDDLYRVLVPAREGGQPRREDAGEGVA
ncbi:MAG TPA: hypothetical protein EYH27_04410 [Anaerolineales bacterium]|nr:hypothetical protein [Anaerolineales bacterium]